MEGASFLRAQTQGIWQRPMNSRSGAPADSILRAAAMGSYTQKERFRGYTLVPGLSTAETVTYVNPNTRQAIIAMRGTHTLSDVVTDGRLALGLTTARTFSSVMLISCMILQAVEERAPSQATWTAWAMGLICLPLTMVRNLFRHCVTSWRLHRTGHQESSSWTCQER